MALITVDIPTVTLKRWHVEVIAKIYKGDLCAKTYANLKQATTAAAAFPGWRVYHFPGSTPFYIGRLAQD